MKSNRRLGDSWVIIISLMLACLIGCGVLYFVFFDYDIPWRRYPIPDAPKEIVDIVQVQIQSYDVYGPEPTGDIIYVATEDGEVYSNKIPDSEWQLVEVAPDLDHSYPEISSCAPVWPGAPSGAQIWDPPPVEKDVVDSAGARIESSMAIDVRCYVLTDDGALELWERGDSAIRIMAAIWWAPWVGCLAIIVGIVTGVLINRYRRREESGTNHGQSIESPPRSASTSLRSQTTFVLPSGPKTHFAKMAQGYSTTDGDSYDHSLLRRTDQTQ